MEMEGRLLHKRDSDPPTNSIHLKHHSPSPKSAVHSPKKSGRRRSMKLSLATLLGLSLLGLAHLATSAEYTSKYDNIDVDKILANDRILSQYIKCLMEEGNCTNEGRELKKTLPDALATGCNKCSEKQKLNTEKVLRHLSKHRARDWARLKAKYDPKGEFSKKYEGRSLINPSSSTPATSS